MEIHKLWETDNDIALQHICRSSFINSWKLLFTVKNFFVGFEDAPQGTARHYNNAPFHESMQKGRMVYPFPRPYINIIMCHVDISK